MGASPACQQLKRPVVSQEVSNTKDVVRSLVTPQSADQSILPSHGRRGQVRPACQLGQGPGQERYLSEGSLVRLYLYLPSAASSGLRVSIIG